MNIQGSLGFLSSHNSVSSLDDVMQESTSFEETALKSSSQIDVQDISQQKKSSTSWSDEERETLRKVMSDYKIKYSEDLPIKWTYVTTIFNQIMQKKESSSSLRNSKRVSEQWHDYLNPFVIQGTIQKKHELPVLELISYFCRRSTDQKAPWASLRNFIKEHNGGYYYSANALKNLYNTPRRRVAVDVLKKGGEISEDQAVGIAESLQLHLESVKNQQKGKSIAISVDSSLLKKRVLEDGDVSNHRMKSPSQIQADGMSQQERSNNFWIEEERAVLRDVVSAYKTICSEGTPIKWSCITSVFNRIMKEKDSSRPQRESKSLLRQWKNCETERASVDVLKKGGEISEDEAVRFAEFLQLHSQLVENEEKSSHTLDSANTSSLKQGDLEGVDSSNDPLDAFVFDPDFF